MKQPPPPRSVPPSRAFPLPGPVLPTPNPEGQTRSLGKPSGNRALAESLAPFGKCKRWAGRRTWKLPTTTRPAALVQPVMSVVVLTQE